ncbi:MAG: hypothetical protein ACKO5F_04475 [Synechococcus sp.]
MAVAAANPNRRQRKAMVRRALGVNQLLVALADARHSSSTGVASLPGLFSRGLCESWPDRDPPHGHRTVEATDRSPAQRRIDSVDQHTEARCGPVRCTITLEPPAYASAEIPFRGTHG